MIVGAVVGCLALVAALGAGGFYCYKKRMPPPRPANVEVVVSSAAANKDATRDSAKRTEQKEEEAGAPAPDVSQPVLATPSGETNITAVLASCGLEHRAKLFEDEGYTLEVAFRALDSGESTLMTDLRDLTLNLGECRKLIAQLKAAKNSNI